MERLTEWNGGQTRHAYYPRCFEEPCYGGGCKIKDCPFETAVCERLAAYEDTGLTPESVEALKLSMMGKAISEITEFDGLPIDRLRELAEADKDGRVLILPHEDYTWSIRGDIAIGIVKANCRHAAKNEKALQEMEDKKDG